MKLLLLSLCLAQYPLLAQQSTPEDPGRDVTSADNPGRVPQFVAPEPGSFPLQPFIEGLWSRYSSNVIPDTALAEALNVVLDEDVDGVVVTRRGRVRCASTPITDLKTVRAQTQFNAPDGTKFHIAVSSESIYEHSGNCTWTEIPGFNGWDSSLDIDLLSFLGRVWATDGTKLVSWNGTSTQPVSGAPAGNLLDGFRNRLLIANINGSQSQVHMSGELNGEDWVLPALSVTTSPVILSLGGVNDGNRITCLMGAYGDVYFIGKDDAIFGIYGFDTRDFLVREISREVGCLEDKSVQEKNNRLYWLSKRGVERMTGPVIERVSDQIRDLVDVIIQTAGSPRSHRDSSQSDWEAGNLEAAGPGAPMSTTILPGLLQGSTFFAIDTSSTDFSAGMFEQVGLFGDTVTLTSTTLKDDFSDFEIGSDPPWTVRVGSFEATEGFVRGIANDTLSRMDTPFSVSSGSYKFSHRYNDMTGVGVNLRKCHGSPGEICGEFRFIQNAGEDFYAVRIVQGNTTQLHPVQLVKSISGSVEVLGSFTDFYTQNVFHSYEVIVSTKGEITVRIDGTLRISATDISITSSVVFAVSLWKGPITISVAQKNDVDNIDCFGFDSSGVFTSQIFDTGFSTPTGGVFTENSIFLPGDEGGIFFDIHSSTSPNGDLFNSFSATSDTLKINEVQQFWQYRARFNTEIATKTPVLQNVSLPAGTTAQFIASCIDTTGVSAFKTFGCDFESFDGSWSVEVSTGMSCQDVQVSTADWQSHINNATVSVGTGAFTGYRLTSDYDLFVATGNPFTRSCQLNWVEGAARPPVVAEVIKDRYHLSYTSSTDAGSSNDHQLVLDRNDKWTLFDNTFCASLTIYERGLYCGDSNATGLVFQQDVGTDDDGSAFVARIKTKAYNLGMPARRKAFEDLFLDLEPAPGPNDMITLNARYYVDRGTVPIELGPVDLGEDGQHLLTTEFNFPVASEQTASRYIQLELESIGANQPWRLFGGRLYFRILSKE